MADEANRGEMRAAAQFLHANLNRVPMKERADGAYVAEDLERRMEKAPGGGMLAPSTPVHAAETLKKMTDGIPSKRMREAYESVAKSVEALPMPPLSARTSERIATFVGSIMEEDLWQPRMDRQVQVKDFTDARSALETYNRLEAMNTRGAPRLEGETQAMDVVMSRLALVMAASADRAMEQKALRSPPDWETFQITSPYAYDQLGRDQSDQARGVAAQARGAAASGHAVGIKGGGIKGGGSEMAAAPSRSMER